MNELFNSFPNNIEVFDPSFILNELEGKVWVRDGLIYCSPANNKFPTITVNKNINLMKNGEHVEGTIVVSKTDHFTIKDSAPTPKVNWQVNIDSTKNRVVLYIKPSERKYFKLEDVEPGYHITLKTYEVNEPFNPLTIDEIMTKLNLLNIQYGIDYSEIVKAVNTKVEDEFIIARGSDPTEGENGRIEVLVETKVKKAFLEKEDGLINYKEVKQIPTVNIGEVIAKVHPPKAGIAGLGVTFQPIHCKPTFPIKLKLGNGVALLRDGETLVATEAGRPFLEQNGLLVKVSIVSKLTHKGDVTLQTGNLHFKGDIEIFGNVEDGMKVEADGSVRVSGNANFSTISSKQSLFINKNILSSTIIVGENPKEITELIKTLSRINQELVTMLKSLERIIQTNKFSSQQPINIFQFILHLVDHHSLDLKKLCSKLFNQSQKPAFLVDKELTSLVGRLKNSFFTSLKSDLHTMPQLIILANDIQVVLDKYKAMTNEESNLQVSYVLNSIISCNGNIEIFGLGCYNSNIYAKGKVHINGILRGGEVFGKLGVFIKESGSVGGVITKVIVPSDEVIQFDLVREGTFIQIGNKQYIFQTDWKKIVASLSKENEIEFNSY